MTPGDVTESRTRAQRHGRVRLALALAVVAIVTGGAVVLARRSIAERLVHLALASAGHGDARLEVVDVGPRGIELHDLRIGVAPALELDALDVRWTPWRGRIDALHARGLRMRADLRGAAPVASPAAAPDLSPLALALPRAIRIEDARIDLDTDVGPLSLALAASLEPAGAEVEGAAQLEIQSGASRADLSLAVRGTPGKLGGTLALRADVDGLPQLPLALRANGTARVAWDGHALELYTPECLDVRVERIGRVLRLASPLVACAGEPGARLLRVELAGGSPRYRADVPLRARELRLAWSGGTLAARAPRLALTVDST